MRLWVGKSPAGYPASSSSPNRAVVRSKSDGELFASSSQGYNPGFSTPPSRHLSPNSKGAGLRRSSTLPMLGYSHDALMPAPGAPEVSWDSISWTPPGITTSNDSPPTPPFSHSPSSTDSSSGDRTIQTSSFIDIASPANPFLPCNTSDKAPPLSFDRQAPPYTYTAQSHAMLDVDPKLGLSFPSYVSHGVNVTFAYDNSSLTNAMYANWAD